MSRDEASSRALRTPAGERSRTSDGCQRVTGLPSAGPVEQATTIRMLAVELHRAGVLAAPVTTPAPETAKSGTVQVIAQLAVTGVFSAAALQAISRIAVAFIKRRDAQKIKLKAGDVQIEIDGPLGNAQQEALTRMITSLQEKREIE